MCGVARPLLGRELRPEPGIRRPAERVCPRYFSGRIVIRSVSLPSAEREMYFTLAVTFAATHPELLQTIPGLFGVLLGVPVESVTVTLTELPRQTVSLLTFRPSEVGSMMFPAIRCRTLALFVAL